MANAEKLRLETRQRMVVLVPLILFQFFFWVHCPIFSMTSYIFITSSSTCNFLMYCLHHETHMHCLSALTDHIYIRACRQGRCRRVAGNQDGSKGTAMMEHSAMLEVIGRQGRRGNGMAAMTYLATCLATQNCNHPLSTLAQVYKD